jgi:hypothetical protein
MRKINWNKTFEMGDISIECGVQDTRYGFRHLAVLRGNGMRVEAKACYYNRTWESYTYQSVLRSVLNKAFPKTDIDAYMKGFDDQATGRINQQFGMIAGIAKLGEILCDNQKDKNDWKMRMLKAGLENQGLMIPDDWGLLSEDEKQRRLNGAITAIA